MYKCMMCGRPLSPEEEETLLGPNWRTVKCTCGSRIFVKMRPQRIKRVKVI